MDNKRLKLGSLFDGSGGFPLAGVLHGIEPVWASEIEPFPIRVTKARFPNMKHLGSVTDVRGDQVEPVDIITFGSPCQDLSVAGKQLGIHDGQRSNLFFEAIRIIKEMRDATADKFPRFAVWENVPGAFSSNKGKDFQAVLQAFCSIRGGQDHIVPMPPKDKWLPFGTIVGDGWSVAWRVYDAQYWGVPQRRKRIYLIADFGSERAGEILSECESMCGYPAQSGEAREGTAADAERSVGRSDSVKCLNPWDCQSKRQYSVDGVYRTLDAGNCAGGQAHGICYPAAFMGGQGAKARSIAYCNDGTTPTLKSAPSGGNTVPDVVYAVEGNTVDRASNKNGKGYSDDVSPTLNTQDKHAVTYAIEGNGQRESHQGDGYAETDKMYTLNTIERHAVCFQQNQRDEVRDMGEQAGSLTAEPGMHNQNYLCYPDVAHSLCARHDSSPCVDRGQNVVCYRKSSKPGTDGSGERWVEDEKTNTLNTFEFHSEVRTPEVVAIDCRNMCANEELSATIQAKNGGGHSLNYINPIVYDARGNGDGQIVPTLTGDHQNRVTDYTSLTVARCQSMSEYAIDGTVSTQKARDYKGGAVDVVIEKKPQRKYIVRRLTPTECLRLQGLPDWWVDGANGSDSAIYKMAGNGLAIPCAEDVLGRIAKALQEGTE